MIFFGLVLNGACSRQSPEAQPAPAEPAAKADSTPHPVSLTPAEVAKLGVITTAATAIDYVAQIGGFAVVLSHDAIAQAVADTATAQGAARHSHAVLARMQRLAGTPGADSVETREDAERQAAADTAALLLAQAKASSVLGQRPPWAAHENSHLPAELAAGRAKLLRVTFPLGAWNEGVPGVLRISRLDPRPSGDRWTTRAVWNAPADPDIPGRSFFALLRDSDLGEGERALASAPAGNTDTPTPGVAIPAAAVVVSEGRYWCYVERAPGVFVRTPLDISRPTSDGYFVTAGIHPGDPVVAAAAGMLLARETNPGREAE
jgi:hypothetical protein